MDNLRVLHLEDSALDAELIHARLAEGGLAFRPLRVQTRGDFEAALRAGGFDLILADFSLPSFDGVSALKLAQEVCPDVPFLFVSGAMGEEVAIETLKNGATDYVLKQRLERLVPSVRRALREAAERAERRRLEEALRKRAEELAESARRKDEFLAMLSHELRNPLAPVQNALQVMRLQGIDDPTLRQARDIIERQVEHLTQLVDDLLDMSRVTRGKIQLRAERVDLSGIVPHAVETVRPLIDKRQHRLGMTLAPEALLVTGDRVRLQQIVTNLLTNAAKYTDPGGQIWLSTRREGDEAVLRVRDTGIGISADLQGRIFDLFMQADQSLDRSQGGLGIGLTLVRRLVELHGGTIKVHSPGAGQGSEFTMRLPLSVQEPEPRPTPTQTAAETAAAPQTRNVVVVDDNMDGAQSLAMLLALWGHDVRVAHDGPAALRAVEARRPDVVLLDIGLPGMNGYEVAQRLRRLPAEPMILIALTGYGQEEDRRRSRDAGFDYHLTKPVDPDELQRLLGGVATGAAGCN